MGLIGQIFRTLFGGGRNVVAETAEVFRENAEAAGQRGADLDAAVMAQYAAEFQHARRGWFDSLIDGLNRMIRPLLAITVLLPYVLTFADPLLMTEVFTSWSLIPDMWHTLALTVFAFFFGGRMQIKAQDFQRDVAAAAARAPQVIETMRSIRALRHDSPGAASTGDADTTLAAVSVSASENPALDEIMRRNGTG